MSNLEVFFQDIEPFYFNSEKVEKLVNNIIINEIHEVGDITVILCSDNYLLEINKKYLQHNYFTDIVTFNYVEGKVVSGDLFISIDRIKENAREFKATDEQELLRVIFHGILHLVGYNDKTESEKKTMREKENFYLKNVDLSAIKL